MEEIEKLEKRIDELDTSVRNLQFFLESSRFVPLFTKRMMWAFFTSFVVLAIFLLIGLHQLRTLSQEVHYIYLLLN